MKRFFTVALAVAATLALAGAAFAQMGGPGRMWGGGMGPDPGMMGGAGQFGCPGAAGYAQQHGAAQISE